MPELPELTVVQEVLQRRVVGQTITGVEIAPAGGAIVVRDLTHRGMPQALTGAMIKTVTRRGKFLLFSVASDVENPLFLVLNPKLTGRLQLADPVAKRLPKTHVMFSLSDGNELRYVDAKRMGQLYLTREPALVPDFANMGPEPFDVTVEEFCARLRPYRGEIKGILTRGEFIAGIGNAYADEILWGARIHPYRKRTQLSASEMERLFIAMQTTLREAIEQVRREMGEDIHKKPRDFLAVHMKTGQPCPRCGTTISLVGANQRITNFCRKCQPGGLIRGM